MLQEVGGLLQPSKCAWTIHDTIQDKKGKWGYKDAEKKKGNEKDTEEEEERDDKLDGLEMTVLQLTSDAQAIQLLKSSEAVKTLDSLPGQMSAATNTWIR